MAVEELIASASFVRVDGVHPIDWRINEGDPRKILVLVTDTEPTSVESTDGIEARKWCGSRGDWHLAFVLGDTSYQKMFDSFCDDMVESSRSVNPGNASEFATRRYEHWMRMFRVNKQFLGEQVIEGLLGELISLKDIMFERYGVESSLESWMNKKRGKQDFIQTDLWYEIKTTLEGRHELTITSFEQLDRDDKGHMIVVTLRRSSKQSPNSMTLNSVCAEVEKVLDSPSSRKIFADTIAFAGYEPDPYYDDQCFEMVNLVEYEVREGFPRLRGSQMHIPGVINGTYDIDLNFLTEYEVRRWS